jgi:hypothetical protein
VSAVPIAIGISEGGRKKLLSGIGRDKWCLGSKEQINIVYEKNLFVASIVLSRSSMVSAVERNQVSNAEGGR